MLDVDIKQYFLDGAYKCIPIVIKSPYGLIILIQIMLNCKGLNYALCILLQKKIKTFMQFYSLLKTKYNFIRKGILMIFQNQI